MGETMARPRVRGESSLRQMLRPIDHALSDEAVTEVVVNRPGEVGVERAGAWHWLTVPEFTTDRLDAIAILAAAMTSRDVDSDHPYCNSTLPDGQRIQIALPPATLPGVISLTIRKPSARARRLDDDDFLDLFSRTNIGPSSSTLHDAELRQLLAARDFRGFFRLARHARKTICATGRTGSGKTEFLRRLMQETAETDRIVTIESDPEFGQLGPRNRVNLFYSEQHPAMAAEDVVKASLRMRPDEIWFQEVRGAEAFALLRAWAAGHRGGGTTWHADEGKEIEALTLMVRQHPAAQAFPDEKVVAFCKQFIDVIVWCDRGEDGFRAPRIWFREAEEAVQ
jgi:type IV secretion system protein VirB11